MSRPTAVALLAPLLILGVPAPAAARIMPVFEARVQLDASDAVVRARIVELRTLGPATDPYAGAKAVRLLAAVSVDLVVKGPVAPGPLSIELLANAPEPVLDGLPIYAKGETYLFFLKRGPAHWELVHHDNGARPSSTTARPALASLTDPAARLAALYAASLHDSPYAILIEALDGLGNLGGPAAAAAAAGVARDTARHADVRAHAFAAAIEAGDMEILPDAVRFIETADPKLDPTGQPQHWVRLAIGAHATGAALSALHHLVLHPDTALRLEVSRALRRLHAKASIFFIVRLLDDPVRAVRYHAVQALADIIGKSGEWAPAMGDPAREDRAVALWKKWWKTEGERRFEKKPLPRPRD